MKPNYLVLTFLSLATLAASAQGTPSISMHTENYDLYGEDNLFTLALGSSEPGVIGVDCGYGIEQYEITPAVFDNEIGGLTATYVSCQVSQAGDVRIYCYDDIQIEYFNAEGCGLTSITFAVPETISILNLRHNSLRSLDLSDMCNVVSVDLGDNPFTDSPLIVGGDKPSLTILNLDTVESLSDDFTISDYPALLSFSAMSTHALKQIDPSGCPGLLQLSVDATDIREIDLSQNPELMILNVSETYVTQLDLSANTKLQQLYCNALNLGAPESERLQSLDVSHCPDLIYLFCYNNALTDIDLSHNTNLLEINLRKNKLTHLDLDGCPNLINVYISYNYFNFNTLPMYGDWLEYVYNQYPIPVPKSYLVGSPIDLSEYVEVDGAITIAEVYYRNSEDAGVFYPLDPSVYDYTDGVLTINEVVADSVYVAYSNSIFYEYPMTTTVFKVKSAEEFGQHDYALTMSVPHMGVDDNFALSVGIRGASEANPVKFFVDLGDGGLSEGVATTDTIPAAPNFCRPKGVQGDVTVYVEEGAELTALAFGGSYVESIKLDKLSALKYLSLTATGMQKIDLGYNNMLESLTLTGNHLGSTFTLDGATGAYTKYRLGYIDLRDNELTKFRIPAPETLTYLDLSHNRLDDLNLLDCEYITTLNLSHNDFDYLRLSYLSSMTTFDASHCRLNQIVLPETNVIESMDISYNAFTFASLPGRFDIDPESFVYAPQADILIPAEGMVCTLGAQDVTIDGNATHFAWIDADGNALVEGVDYTISAGTTRFNDSAIGLTVHCEINNAAYPALTVATTPMLLVGRPEHLIGSFTTTGNNTMTLSLAAATPNSAIYIDWKGDGQLTEYVMQPTYTLYTARTTRNAKVKIYSYDADCDLSVFSISGAKLSDVDLSGMTRLHTLAVNNAGISSIVMPAAENLRELYMTSNKFTSFDFTPYPLLNSISFEGNSFVTVDLSPLHNLEAVNFVSNQLESIDFGDNPNLWGIHLSNNNLAEIDFSNVPDAYQIILNNNKFEHIDLDALQSLRVVYLDENRFTFNTLPLPREQWTVYYYANQAPLDVEPVDGVVDLSTQAEVDGVASVYMWLEGTPWYDETEGAMMGNTLAEGIDYVVDNGVTTFLSDFDQVMCIITNDLYPKAYMYTPLIDVTAAGVADVTAVTARVVVNDGAVEVTAVPGTLVEVYTVDGLMLASVVTDLTGHVRIPGLARGCCLIVKAGDAVDKVVIR